MRPDPAMAPTPDEIELGAIWRHSRLDYEVRVTELSSRSVRYIRLHGARLRFVLTRDEFLRTYHPVPAKPRRVWSMWTPKWGSAK